MDCLRGLVGLTANAQPDFGLPAESLQDTYRLSSMGLWAWDLVGPVLLSNGEILPVSNTSTYEDTVWNTLISAYESALAQLPKELATFLGSRLQSAFPAYTGRIGEVATTGVVAVVGSVAGFALPTQVLNGGSLTINRIGLMLNASAPNLSITVSRYDGPLPVLPQGNLSQYLSSAYLTGKTAEIVKVWNLDVTGNDSRTYAVEPLSLPLNGSVYVFSYPVTGNYLPLNNRLSCGCGGKDKTLNAMLSTPISSLNGDHAHGLLLDVTASCDFSGIACDLLLNNQFSAALGYLLYYKTGLNVLTTLLGGQLSPAIQIQKEFLEQKRTEWTAEMNTYLTFMTQNWQADLLPTERCYVCNASGQLYRGTLRL